MPTYTDCTSDEHSQDARLQQLIAGVVQCLEAWTKNDLGLKQHLEHIEPIRTQYAVDSIIEMIGFGYIELVKCLRALSASQNAAWEWQRFCEWVK